MSIELVRPNPGHATELGRICHDAFAAFHDRHAMPRDFALPQAAVELLGWMLASPDEFAVMAVSGGRPVGSNFLTVGDEVGGVGPISVDPSAEGRGIGRALMRAVLDHAEARGMAKVRLMQDSFNMRSLALYASLGFTVRAPIGLMDLQPAAAHDPTIRPATADDDPALSALCRRIYKVDRAAERHAMASIGFPVMLRERAGRVTGYLIPGIAGHGVAETVGDALPLFAQVARVAPPEARMAFCPLPEGDLLRGLLAAGHRLRKVMNLMSSGPWDQPAGGVWMPSIGY